MKEQYTVYEVDCDHHEFPGDFGYLENKFTLVCIEKETFDSELRALQYIKDDTSQRTFTIQKEYVKA